MNGVGNETRIGRGRASQLEPFEGSLRTLRMTVDALIYASVILGAILLIQLYGLGPSWLFYFVFIVTMGFPIS